MIRQQRDDNDLAEAARHVKYEIEMLIYCTEHVRWEYSSPTSRAGEEYKRMALESFLLHYRNLRGFLCPSLHFSRRDDIIASDFFNEVAERDLGDANKLGVDKVRLDQMLAHLTYQRQNYITSGNHSWNIPAMTAAILGELEAFLTVLPERMRSWFPPSEFLSEQRSNMIEIVRRIDLERRKDNEPAQSKESANLGN